MASRRFMCVNPHNAYFIGNRCYRTEDFDADEYVCIVDLDDLVMQRVTCRDLASVPSELLWFDMNWYRGGQRVSMVFKTISDLVGSRYKDAILTVDGKKTRVRLASHRVFINDRVCSLSVQGGCINVSSVGFTVNLAVISGTLNYCHFVFAYRSKDNLVMCYFMSSVVGYDSVSCSISLVYSLESAEFVGYYIYGTQAGIQIVNQQLWMPILAKETLR